MQINLCFGCMEEHSSGPCLHCGYEYGKEPVQSYALQPGTILQGKYLVGKVLGQGGFGITYIGWDLLLSRKVAIKEYFPGAHASRNSTASTQIGWYDTKLAQEARDAGQEMFLKEARKMNRVEGIPQVVHVQNTFQDNGTAYIVMNYIQGENLSKRLKKTGPMPWKEALSLLLPVVDVMQQVHEAGLVHRDLSPDNLMIQPDGSLTILDLGAAKDMSLSSGVSSMQVAKGGFSPPEQYIRRGSSGPWTDVYAMAATIYYAITGVVPPTAVDRMNQDTLKWDLKELRQVPPALIQVLKKAMTLPFRDRYQTMGAFASELRNASSKGSSGWKKVAALAAAVAAVAILIFAAARIALPHERATGESPEPEHIESDTETTEETTEATEPEEDLPDWASNVMMANTVPGQSYDASSAPVFRSRIMRYQILSVTFLDDLEDMGSDNWDISHAQDGSVMAWLDPKGMVEAYSDGKWVKSQGYDLYIGAEGGINAKFCDGLFDGFENMTSIAFNGCFHTDYAEGMADMFSSCYSLQSLDLRDFKTKRVQTMESMFTNSGVKELDVSSFDTSNVTNMWHMFGYLDIKSLDLSNFDTSKVTDMCFMFSGSAVEELDISSFDTSKVMNMSYMFEDSKIRKLDLSHFDTSKVTTMSYMFYGCDQLETLNLEGFDTGKVTNMESMFQGCKKLTTIQGDLLQWDTSKVETYKNFMDAGRLIDGKPWKTMFE